MAEYLMKHVFPQVPDILKEPFKQAVAKGHFKAMQNKALVSMRVCQCVMQNKALVSVGVVKACQAEHSNGGSCSMLARSLACLRLMPCPPPSPVPRSRLSQCRWPALSCWATLTTCGTHSRAGA